MKRKAIIRELRYLRDTAQLNSTQSVEKYDISAANYWSGVSGAYGVAIKLLEQKE